MISSSKRWDTTIWKFGVFLFPCLHMNLRGLLNSIKRENLLMYEYLKNFLIREILDFLYKTIHTRTIDLSGYGNLPNSHFLMGSCSFGSMLFSVSDMVYWSVYKAFGSMNLSSSDVKRLSMFYAVGYAVGGQFFKLTLLVLIRFLNDLKFEDCFHLGFLCVYLYLTFFFHLIKSIWCHNRM